MEHREIKDLIPLLAIGRLEGEERRILLEHLKTCEECRRTYERERSIVRMMEEMNRDIVPPPAPPVRRGLPYGRVLASVFGVVALLIAVFMATKNPLFRGGKEYVSPVEVSGLEDLWGGYVLVQGDGHLKVEVQVDGETVIRKEGTDYLYLEPRVSGGEHYVVVKVIRDRDTLTVDRVVLYDPETYALLTGGG